MPNLPYLRIHVFFRFIIQLKLRKQFLVVISVFQVEFKEIYGALYNNTIFLKHFLKVV